MYDDDGSGGGVVGVEKLVIHKRQMTLKKPRGCVIISSTPFCTINGNVCGVVVDRGSCEDFILRGC